MGFREVDGQDKAFARVGTLLELAHQSSTQQLVKAAHP